LEVGAHAEVSQQIPAAAICWSDIIDTFSRSVLSLRTGAASGMPSAAEKLLTIQMTPDCVACQPLLAREFLSDLFDMAAELRIFAFEEFGQCFPEIRPTAPFPHVIFPGTPEPARLPVQVLLIDKNISAFKDRNENSKQGKSPLLLFFAELS
jgi:hypothetical protein